MRLVGLTLTALLVVFQLWYTNADADARAHVPPWVRGGADVTARALVGALDDATDFLGPRFKRGLRQTKEHLGLREPEPERALTAIGADLSGEDRRAARLGHASLMGARLDGTDFSKAYLVGALLDGASGEGTVFDGAVLEGASLRGAHLFGARFADADLTRADAQAARLPKADLTGAALTNADLTGAVLREARLGGARLGGTNLFRADLSGANLKGAHDLTQRQLDGACGDAATALPDGFSVPPCLPKDL